MPLMDYLLLFMTYGMLIIPLVWPLSLVFLTLLTPRSVIDQYVRPPYFSEFETIAYRNYPGTWLRSMLFAHAIAIPPFRRIRKLGNIHTQVPLYFNLLCRIYVYGVLGYVLLFFLVLGFLLTFGKHFSS